MGVWHHWYTIPVISLALLLLLPTIPASGKSLDISSHIQISDSLRRGQYPGIAVDSEGNFHVIYREYDRESVELIYLIYWKISPLGNPIIGPTTISPEDAGFTGGGEITVDTNDRVHIVFSANQSNNEIRDIYYTQLSMNGSILIGEF
jgi:hypothetical protein